MSEGAVGFSRSGHGFQQFDDLARAIETGRGEAVSGARWLTRRTRAGWAVAVLMARRGSTRFYGFDLLWLDGRDVRGLSLLERKALLRQLVPVADPRLLYVEHVPVDGARFVSAASALDLEGVVGKYADGRYQCGGV